MRAILHFQHNEKLGDALRSLRWDTVKRTFVQKEDRMTFEQICAAFPSSVHEIELDRQPYSGSGFYIEGDDKFPVKLADHYDSGD